MITWLRRAQFRTTALVVASSIVLAGCAMGPAAYDPSLSPAENQLRQANRRFSQTVGEGAVAGAVLGGLAGLALGGRNRAGAAAIGAAAGGALGAGAGYMVARNNLNRSSTEAQFTGAIQQAQADADVYRNSAAASQQVADQADADASRLRSQYQARQISQEQYAASLAKYRADNDLIGKQVSLAQQTAAQIRRDSQVANGSNGAQLSTTASDIETSQRQLEQSQARLSRALAGTA